MRRVPEFLGTVSWLSMAEYSSLLRERIEEQAGTVEESSSSEIGSRRQATAIGAAFGSLAFDLLSNARHVVAFSNQTAKKSSGDISIIANCLGHGSAEKSIVKSKGSEENEIAESIWKLTSKQVGCERR